MKSWALDGQTIKYCNGMGDTPYNQSILDAVANWNMQFAFPFTDFTAFCGAGQKMDIVDDRFSYPCGDGTIACFRVVLWSVDYTRTGYYMDTVRVWVHYPHYDFDEYWGMRSVVAHEIGHAYGLDDKYLHDPIECNPDPLTTVMDAAVYNPQGEVSSGCDWNGPTSADDSDITWLYFMDTPNVQPEILPSIKESSTRIRNPWRDHSPNESYYYLYDQYIWQNNVVTYKTQAWKNGVAPGDQWAVTDMSYTLVKPPYTPPNTFYRTCMMLYSGVIGYQYPRCFNWQLLEG
jgi:hypothetical protein